MSAFYESGFGVKEGRKIKMVFDLLVTAGADSCFGGQSLIDGECT